MARCSAAKEFMMQYHYALPALDILRHQFLCLIMLRIYISSATATMATMASTLPTETQASNSLKIKLYIGQRQRIVALAA